MPKQRYVRRGDTLHDEEIVVVRGGELDADILRSDAARYFAVYGVYGISVFAARDVTIDEIAQEPPLVRFEILALVQVGVLKEAGFLLEATGRNPRHFTVSFDDLDDGVERLRRCEHRLWPNPYHDD